MNKNIRAVIRLGNVQHKTVQEIAKQWSMSEKTVQSILDKNPPKPQEDMSTKKSMAKRKREAKKLYDDGYTHVEIADLLGVSDSTISRDLNGRKSRTGDRIKTSIKASTETNKTTESKPKQVKQSTTSYSVLWGAFTFSKTK